VPSSRNTKDIESKVLIYAKLIQLSKRKGRILV